MNKKSRLISFSLGAAFAVGAVSVAGDAHAYNPFKTKTKSRGAPACADLTPQELGYQNGDQPVQSGDKTVKASEAARAANVAWKAACAEGWTKQEYLSKLDNGEQHERALKQAEEQLRQDLRATAERSDRINRQGQPEMRPYKSRNGTPSTPDTGTIPPAAANGADVGSTTPLFSLSLPASSEYAKGEIDFDFNNRVIGNGLETAGSLSAKLNIVALGLRAELARLVASGGNDGRSSRGRIALYTIGTATSITPSFNTAELDRAAAADQAANNGATTGGAIQRLLSSRAVRGGLVWQTTAGRVEDAGNTAGRGLIDFNLPIASANVSKDIPVATIAKIKARAGAAANFRLSVKLGLDRNNNPKSVRIEVNPGFTSALTGSVTIELTPSAIATIRGVPLIGEQAANFLNSLTVGLEAVFYPLQIAMQNVAALSVVAANERQWKLQSGLLSKFLDVRADNQTFPSRAVAGQIYFTITKRNGGLCGLWNGARTFLRLPVPECRQEGGQDKVKIPLLPAAAERGIVIKDFTRNRDGVLFDNSTNPWTSPPWDNTNVPPPAPPRPPEPLPGTVPSGPETLPNGQPNPEVAPTPNPAFPADPGAPPPRPGEPPPAPPPVMQPVAADPPPELPNSQL